MVNESRPTLEAGSSPEGDEPQLVLLIPLSFREASEEDEADQGDDQPDPPVPKQKCEDNPDDHKNAAEANPAKTRTCCSISHTSPFAAGVALSGLCLS